MHEPVDTPGATTEHGRLLATLQRLLAIQTTELRGALEEAAQLVAEALGADKVDAMLHDQQADVLVAIGVSNTPMGHRERALGLDRLPVAAGGRTVAVWQTGQPFITGAAEQDPNVLDGFKHDLGIRSMIVVPLDVRGTRRGLLGAATTRPHAFSVEDLTFLQAVGHWVGMVAHHAELSEQAARHARDQAVRSLSERSAWRAARLQALTAALSKALTTEQMADVIITQGVEILQASAGAVALLSDDGTYLTVLRFVGYGSDRADASREVRVDAEAPLADVVRSGEPLLLESPAHLDARYPNLANSTVPPAIGAAAALPLVVRGSAIGAIRLDFPSARHFDDADRVSLQTLADLCAQALDRARLYDAAQQARITAEKATTRLQALQSVTDVVLAHINIEDLLRRALERITSIFAADNTAILVVDKDDRTLIVYMAHGPEEEVEGQVRVPIGRGIAGRIARDREPLIVDDVDKMDPVNPFLRAHIRSLMGVPLMVADRLVGIIHVGSTTFRHFTSEELGLLQLVADRVALAVYNAKLYSSEREARTEAERAVRLRDDILGIATHDLRSPLTTIMGRAQLMQRRIERGIADREWLDSQLQTVRETTAHMRVTIDEMGDVTRLHMGEALELRLEDVNISDLARTVTDEFRSEPHPLSIAIEAPSLVVRGDRNRLTRVLRNLIGNAIKYSTGGTPVDVTVSADSAQAIITVADSGVGIPADELPHVFTRFYRASTAAGIQGTGIGLSGSRAIIEQHGGQIDLASEVGKGTVVVVRLPLAQDAEGYPGGANST